MFYWSFHDALINYSVRIIIKYELKIFISTQSARKQRMNLNIKKPINLDILIVEIAFTF